MNVSESNKKEGVIPGFPYLTYEGVDRVKKRIENIRDEFLEYFSNSKKETIRNVGFDELILAIKDSSKKTEEQEEKILKLVKNLTDNK